MEREKSAVWGWRNFVAAACRRRRRRRRRRCCRLTPSPSSSYLSAPEVFSSSRFQSPLSSASGFFDCGSQLLPQLLPQLPSFSVAFLVLNSGQVRAVFRLPTPPHLSTHRDSCALMGLSACRRSCANSLWPPVLTWISSLPFVRL